MKVVVVLLSLFVALAASAQDRLVSINAFDLAYSGGWVFKHDKAKRGDDHDQNVFKINLNYAQKLPDYPQLMWKAVVRLERDSDDQARKSVNSVFGAYGGALFNFEPSDVKNSFYAGAQAGVERQVVDNGVDDESGFNLVLNLEGGKRWDMGEYSLAHISYAPSFELLVRRYGGDIRDRFYKSGREVRLNFLKFDIHF